MMLIVQGLFLREMKDQVILMTNFKTDAPTNVSSILSKLIRDCNIIINEVEVIHLL